MDKPYVQDQHNERKVEDQQDVQDEQDERKVDQVDVQEQPGVQVQDERKVEDQPCLDTSRRASRNWRTQNSETNFFINNPNAGEGFMAQSRRSATTCQWRTSGQENKFFGKRPAPKQEGNWRTDRTQSKFFGERSAQGNKLTINDNWKRPAQNQLNTCRNNQKPPPKKHVTFDVADQLAKHPQELETFLVENLTDFSKFLAPPLPPNTVVQLVQILEKVCSFKTSKFSNVILSRLHKNFMEQLDKYFVKLSLDEEEDKAENELFWNDPEGFWNSALMVFETIIDRLQKAATLHLDRVIKACLVTITYHKNSHGVCVKDAIPKKLGQLRNRLASLKKISEQTQNPSEDDYQTMSVIPHPSEVLTRIKPFVRQNIIDGSYMSVEHYLDTHFRLLREDFLAPLREAICTYKHSLYTNEYVQITEFRVYPTANFIHESDQYQWLKISEYDSYIGNRVRRSSFQLLLYGECTKKHINTEEVFMPGSLLCFSSDNFETMFFGIAARLMGTPKEFIDVQLLEEVPFLQDKEYTMLECSTYFSTYYMVLKALQNFNTTDFPMEKYIVDVVNDPQPPQYLNLSTKFTLGDLKFTVLDDTTWPCKEELKLNEMQYEAFKEALTSSCAIIQGPPGTGKTHLGLKIAQTLIESMRSHNGFYSFNEEKKYYGIDSMIEEILRSKVNSRFPRSEIPDTILVVAYTNHALDQFLEGLMPYTENIVRLGRQSKNDKVSQFTFLGSKRNTWVLQEYYKDISTIIQRKRVLMLELESVLGYGGIFNVGKIPKLRHNDLYSWSSEKIKLWLLGDFSTEKARQDRWAMVAEMENGFEARNTERPLHYVYLKDYIVTVSSLKSFARQLERTLHLKDTITMETMFEDWDYIEESYTQIQDNIEYLEWRLHHASEHAKLYHTRPVDDEGDLFELSYNDRWILYFHWLDDYTQHLKNALNSNNSTLRRSWEKLEEYKQIEDSHQIQRATVVGMTTSGAAKHRRLLEELNCRIVIVEEAAEVLESHIIVSLTSRCEHLILIGDHQQLRPNTANYQIEKQYQLGISLFERLVRNGIRYSTLGVQHRMRPEISRLIVPAIYENLADHASVSTFGNIDGIQHNVFFITHSHPEVEIGSSRKNPHEAKYLIALARHLILQGNKPSEITILTTYKGQMYAIMDEQKSSTFLPVKSVQVTVVDNFQGEENQIILLSLVRSNNQGSIGFLRVENRVCVALSRAKKGFFMIGNMNILTSCSDIWPKVNEVLEENEQIGPGLPLACQLHPQHVTTVIQPEDFLKVPDGGCHLPCKAALTCGHLCKRKCHVTDMDHKDYLCFEDCTKILCEENHKCPEKCWKRCGPCRVPMERLLPCEHQQMVPCSMRIEEFKCTVIVATLLNCEHTVDKPCSANKNTFTCPIEVETIKPACGHLVKKKCSETVDDVKCRTVQPVKMSCGHSSISECWRDPDRRMFYCEELCLKALECGHICEKQCHYFVDKTHLRRYKCQANCTKLKIDCKSNHICNAPCSTPCEPCRHNINVTLPCGHAKTVPCRKSDRKYRCDWPCRKIKQCGHVCHGKCHSICDSTCVFKVHKKFPNCGHTIKVNCSEDISRKDCMKCLKKKIKKG